MGRRIGIILSVLAIVAGFVYGAQDSDRYPDLSFINDIIAILGVAVALAVIWLGVGLVHLLGRRRRMREIR